MKKIIIANWKMNPADKTSVSRYFAVLGRARAALRGAEVVVAPPFPYLALVPRISAYALAAQDLFWEKEGAYTGEVSASMLKALGIRYAIVGHSERRRLGETNAMVAKKVRAALDAKLTPILCVGEEKRDAEGAFLSALRIQLEESSALVKPSEIGRVVVAYEPVWAVGAGHRAALPKDAAEASLFIKKTLATRFGSSRVRGVRIVYGGSTSPINARDFLKEREVAGLLVGRESLDAKSFIAIVQCAKLAL